MIKENIVLKWAHKFGIDSLNDLLINTVALREYLIEEKNQGQITLMDEVDEEKNQELIRPESLQNSENQDEIKSESNDIETSIHNKLLSKKQDSNQIQLHTKNQKSPLPYIKNLRKWINNDKKAS